MKVKCIRECKVNEFNNGGTTFVKGEVYEATELSVSGFLCVKHPSGSEIGFAGDALLYFEECE